MLYEKCRITTAYGVFPSMACGVDLWLWYLTPVAQGLLGLWTPHYPINSTFFNQSLASVLLGPHSEEEATQVLALQAVWGCQLSSHWWFVFWSPCCEPCGSDKGSWLSGFVVAVTMKRRNDPECTAPIKKQKKRVAELALSLSSTSDDEPPSSVNHAAKGKPTCVVRGHWLSGCLNPWCLTWAEYCPRPLEEN